MRCLASLQAGPYPKPGRRPVIEYNKNNVQFVKTDSSVVAVKLHLLYHTVCSDF